SGPMGSSTRGRTIAGAQHRDCRYSHSCPCVDVPESPAVIYLAKDVVAGQVVGVQPVFGHLAPKQHDDDRVGWASHDVAHYAPSVHSSEGPGPTGAERGGRIMDRTRDTAGSRAIVRRCTPSEPRIAPGRLCYERPSARAAR